MAEKKESSVSVDIRPLEGTDIVQYGFVKDGVFHPVAGERQGDFDERVAAAREESE